MLKVSSIVFREKQAEYMDMADNGEQVKMAFISRPKCLQKLKYRSNKLRKEKQQLLEVAKN